MCVFLFLGAQLHYSWEASRHGCNTVVGTNDLDGLTTS